MVFSSIEFIFIFLPIFFLVYYFLPFKFKNIWLFIASLVFYSYGVLDNPLYILFIANINIAQLLFRHRNKQKRAKPPRLAGRGLGL